MTRQIRLTCDSGPLDDLQVLQARDDLAFDAEKSRRHVSMMKGTQEEDTAYLKVIPTLYSTPCQSNLSSIRAENLLLTQLGLPL
jgi:hypothetical protein